jgi:repressor LexA
MDELTPRQQEVLDYVTRHAQSEGLPPTIAEIARAFGIQPHAAHKHLLAIGAKGGLTLLPGKARGIRLKPPAPAPRSGLLDLPVLGRVAAGAPIGADAGSDDRLAVDQALFTRRPDYLLRVRGDSMTGDGILDGDLIAVQRSPVAGNGQIVVARLDGEITIKRLQQEKDRLRLLPRNPDYAPIEVPADADFAIEGLYCGLLRGA